MIDWYFSKTLRSQYLSTISQYETMKMLIDMHLLCEKFTLFSTQKRVKFSIKRGYLRKKQVKSS